MAIQVLMADDFIIYAEKNGEVARLTAQLGSCGPLRFSGTQRVCERACEAH
jgi:hypothetical protein